MDDGLITFVCLAADYPTVMIRMIRKKVKIQQSTNN